MNTSRIVRGTKARIFVYVCAILIVTGIIACYNNTLSQLEEARKSSEICHQQEENLSTQLQVISDYKQRLEKSLKTERADHQQTKTELENKLKEEKSKNDKTANEANLRFNSLQQHSSMLQTQFDDFKEECSKSQKKQLDEINDLQSKLNEIQEELKKIERAKENLKSQNTQLEIDNQKQKEENKALRKEIDLLKETNTEEKSFKINGTHQFKVKTSTESNKSPSILQGRNIEAKPQQSYERVLAAPVSSNNLSTKSTTSPSIKNVSIGSLDRAAPIAVPTVTPKSNKISQINNNVDDNNNNNNNNEEEKAALPLPYQKFPKGVVPVHENLDTKKTEDEKLNEINGENFKVRYRNKIVQEKEKISEDKENGAHEEFDQPAQNNQFEPFGFEDPAGKLGEKHHIDNLAIGKDEIGKDLNENDVPVENELDADDDADDYNDRIERQKDDVVRN